jgi:hypothetical protein
MARNEDRMNIYMPAWLKKRAEKELPPNESVSAIAVDALLMRLDQLKAQRQAEETAQ